MKQTVEIGHFVGLNLDLKKLAECKYIKFRFGRIPKECYEKLSKYEDNPYVLFFQCTSDATHYWGVYIAPVEYIQQVDTIFSGLYFERLRVKALESTPEKMLQELQEKISELKAQIAGLQKQIDDNWNQEAEKCQQVFSKLEELDTYFNIRKYVAKHDNSFILTGWIPEEDEENFRERLSKIDGIDYAVEDASEAVRHTPPTRLVNKKLFKPFEFFVDMFGLPNYHEIDPTPFVAITYVLIAFAGISLVTSMIMIGIITYTSVIERTKEIGILKALGARKKDITRVFDAETAILGVASGILGVVIAFLATFPINAVLYNLTDLENVATLNPIHGIILIVISTILTMIGGHIPARMAAKKDAAVALRAE